MVKIWYNQQKWLIARNGNPLGLRRMHNGTTITEKYKSWCKLCNTQVSGEDVKMNFNYPQGN